MKINFNSSRKSIKSRVNSTYYMVTGVISRLSASYLDRSNIVTNSMELETYVHQDSPEFNELNHLINSGYALELANAYEDSESLHSYMTPISSDLVMPCRRLNSLSGVTLRDPSEFIDETYVINMSYDPNQSSDGFYICLPTLHGDESEFMTPINVYIFGEKPSWVDDDTEVFNIEVTGQTLGEVFDDLAAQINSGDEGMNYFLRDFLVKDVTNIDGVFSICYKSPVKYVPKGEFISSIEYDYSLSANIEFLQNYIPEGTVTIESKLLGDCSSVEVSYSDGILSIESGPILESFEVNGLSNSGNFIGDIQSDLVDIHVNTDGRVDIEMPEFKYNFKPRVDLRNIPISVQESILSLSQSELESNFIVLSDNLVDLPEELDVSELYRELMIISSQELTKLIKEPISNSIRFSGLIDGLPAYLQFLRYVHSCDPSVKITGVQSHLPELDSVDLGIFYPITPEFYTEIKLGWIPLMAVDFKFDLNLINIYQLIYVMALSKFILRYKHRLLHVVSPINSLRSLISEFRVRYPIYESINVANYRMEDNYLYVELSSRLNSLTNYSSLNLNFNLNI